MFREEIQLKSAWNLVWEVRVNEVQSLSLFLIMGYMVGKEFHNLGQVHSCFSRFCHISALAQSCISKVSDITPRQVLDFQIDNSYTGASLM